MHAPGGSFEWPAACSNRGAVRDGRTGRVFKPDRAGNPERTGQCPVRSCRPPEHPVKAAGKPNRTSRKRYRAAAAALVNRTGANRHERRKRNVHRSNVPSPSPQPGQHPESEGRFKPPLNGRIVCATPGNRIPENNTTNATNKGDSVRRTSAI